MGTTAASKKTMTTSANGLAFIQKWEGFSPKLYDDAAGYCTFGYGHLVAKDKCDNLQPDQKKPYEGLTEEEAKTKASQLLASDLVPAEKAVNDHVTVDLTQNQFDALVSFAYNVGVGNFKSSTLLDKVNAQEFDKVPGEFKKWVKAGGKRVQGLVNRRQEEADLFQKAD